MAKIGRPIKFVIRLTPEERTRLDGMIHCGKGSVNSALKARILLKPKFSSWSLIPASIGRCFHSISVRLMPIVRPKRITQWVSRF